MARQYPPQVESESDRQLKPAPGVTESKRFIVGDLIRSNAAIGDGALLIINQAQSAADEARALENLEREKLARAVVSQVGKLYEQANAPHAVVSSLYKYLLPFELADTTRFFGRDAVISRLLGNLMCKDRRCRFVILHGDAGMGKTSLLRAGLEPALIAGQHLPLYVRVTTAPLIDSIKQSLIPNLNTVPILKNAPLLDFVSQIVELLPEGKHVFVLLDQFEIFFSSQQEERQDFVSALAQCLSDEPACHWLVSIRSAFFGHLETFAPTIDQPHASSYVLPPLSKEEARTAIQEPTRMAGINLEDGLMDKILADLGGDAVDPSRLQLVCNTLFEGLEPGQKQVRLAEYEQIGGVKGVLRDHLDLVLERNLPVRDRTRAWQLLAILAEEGGGQVATKDLLAEMKSYGIEAREVRRLLGTLESNRLIRQRDERWRLTSESLLTRIREWSNQRAVFEQAQQEARKQLKRVRNSALRGLLGGALGFCLAYLVVFFNQMDKGSYLGLLTFYRSLPGAMAGFLLIFSMDMAQAVYHGSRRWMRWLTSGLVGAVAFMLALVLHTALNLAAVNLSSVIGFSVEGAMWGVVAGLGAQWVVSVKRPLWQILAVIAVAVFSALVLLIGESFSHALQRPRIQVVAGAPFAWQVLLAGALMPLFIIASALLGRESRSGLDED